MKLYNTLTKKKEEFQPIENNTVRIYSCGPTVYASPSIGNMRAYIFVDILKKTLELKKFTVEDVMNTTDVGHLQSDADDGEDKIEEAAKKAKLRPQDIAKKYTEEFFNACKRLNIRTPKIIAPATNYIPHMIEHIKALESKGFIYQTDDGVYFDSGKFEKYYELSGKKPTGDKAGKRTEMRQKKNANDFAVWKLTRPTVLQSWKSPWGVGCPGWHIECSAIARHYFGDTFDIHTGGVDHINIHHTNEIAQTQALTGKPMAKFWLHNEFIKVDGKKMSKSLGNVYTIPQLEEKGFNPLAFRYYVLLAHYRTIMNFTLDGMQAAQNAYDNLVRELSKHKQDQYVLSGNMLVMMYEMILIMEELLADDLNTPQVLALVWKLVKLPPSGGIYRAITEIDKVLSLGLEDAVEKFLAIKDTEVPNEILELGKKRQEAKQKKDFALADKLRDQIKEKGFEITDTKDGFVLINKIS